jgi:transcription termination/antitermination protein NusG
VTMPRRDERGGMRADKGIDMDPVQEPMNKQDPLAQENDIEAQTEPQEQAEGVLDDGREWYVIHSYSGYENKVKQNLEQRIETMGMQDKIFQVVVPTEEEVEIRDGQRRTSRKRVFPGYVLVQMILDDESWYVVRNTPGITGFVGSGTDPIPLSQEEVDKILARMEEEKPRIRLNYRVGETVRITEGPFADFMAVVDELYPDRGKVRLLVSFFGRETPVEMDFMQIEKT